MVSGKFYFSAELSNAKGSLTNHFKCHRRNSSQQTLFPTIKTKVIHGKHLTSDKKVILGHEFLINFMDFQTSPCPNKNLNNHIDVRRFKATFQTQNKIKLD